MGALGQGTRVLILASEVEGVFCAGADLKERRGMSGQETGEFLAHLRHTMHTLSSLPHTPTLSAIAAPAFGGGFELALATDLRFLTPSAKLALPETHLGIIPGAGGTWRLQRLIGKGRAMDLVLSGRAISGGEAADMGVGRLVERNEGKGGEDEREAVLKAAVEWARGVCEGAPGAVRAATRAVREGSEEIEGREYEGVVGMGDRDEALMAFKQKRRAVFKGR